MSGHVKRGVKRGRDEADTLPEIAPPGGTTLEKIQSIIPPVTTSANIARSTVAGSEVSVEASSASSASSALTPEATAPSAETSSTIAPSASTSPAVGPSAAIPADFSYSTAAQSKLSPTNVLLTPKNAVLSTVELLEKILLALPMKDLLLSQRVSQHRKNVIDGSIKIQRALFFLPETEPTLYVYNRRRDTFRKATQVDLALNLDARKSRSEFAYGNYIIQANKINTLLVKVPTRFSLLTSWLFDKRRDSDPGQRLDQQNHYRVSTTPSWERMYIVQPASSSVKDDLRLLTWDSDGIMDRVP